MAVMYVTRQGLLRGIGRQTHNRLAGQKLPERVETGESERVANCCINGGPRGISGHLWERRQCLNGEPVELPG